MTKPYLHSVVSADHRRQRCRPVWVVDLTSTRCVGGLVFPWATSSLGAYCPWLILSSGFGRSLFSPVWPLTDTVYTSPTGWQNLRVEAQSSAFDHLALMKVYGGWRTCSGVGGASHAASLSQAKGGRHLNLDNRDNEDVLQTTDGALATSRWSGCHRVVAC